MAKTLTIALKFINVALDDMDKAKPQIGSYVQDFFAGAAAKIKKDAPTIRLMTGPVGGTVRDIDVLCYVLGSASDSIVKGAFGVSPGTTETGNTVWSPEKNQMISEVYVDKTDTDAQRIKLIGYIICHELMHNKLDTYPQTMPIKDIHAIVGGAVSKEKISTSDAPSEADKDALAKGLLIAVPQYTGAL